MNFAYFSQKVYVSMSNGLIFEIWNSKHSNQILVIGNSGKMKRQEDFGACPQCEEDDIWLEDDLIEKANQGQACSQHSLGLPCPP
jgi:hypothetical protein